MGIFLNINFFFLEALKNLDYWNTYIHILYVDHVFSLNIFLFKYDCCHTSDVFLEIIYYSWVFQIDFVASVHGSAGSQSNAMSALEFETNI